MKQQGVIYIRDCNFIVNTLDFTKTVTFNLQYP